jgi:hypothetical protein
LVFIKSAREIALEKVSQKKLSSKEIDEIKQQAKIDTVLAKYYKDQIEPDQLWSHLKEIPEKYLSLAQNNFLKTLTFYSNPYDTEKRKKGLLAIEKVKKIDQSSDVEFYFNQLVEVQNGFQNEIDQSMEKVKKDLENNPEKRLRTFQQGNQIIIKELSVEEIVEQDKGLKEALKQIEKEYIDKYNILKERLADFLNKAVE